MLSDTPIGRLIPTSQIHGAYGIRLNCSFLGDYEVDGIAATAILTSAVCMVGGRCTVRWWSNNFRAASVPSARNQEQPLPGWRHFRRLQLAHPMMRQRPAHWRFAFVCLEEHLNRVAAF